MATTEVGAADAGVRFRRLGFEPDTARSTTGAGGAAANSFGHTSGGLGFGLDAVLGRNDPDALDIHRIEYREPSIWIWRRLVGASFAFIVISLTWYLLKVPSGLISDDALPTQTQVSRALNEVWYQGFAGATLAHHAGLSLLRLALGLGLGSVAGVMVGLLAGAAPLTRTVVDPIVSFFRMVPALVVAPLILVWAGAGEVATVLVVALSVLWTVMASASESRIRGLRGTTADLPLEVVTSMRSALLVGWLTLMAIETVLAAKGLGSMVWFAQDRTDVIMVGICAAGLIGFALDTALRAAQYFLTIAAFGP